MRLSHANRRAFGVGNLPNAGEEEQRPEQNRGGPSEGMPPARHVKWNRRAGSLCHTVGHGPNCNSPVHPPMKLLACALLLAASTRVELLDETPTIRRGEWNWYPVSLRQRTAT